MSHALYLLNAQNICFTQGGTAFLPSVSLTINAGEFLFVTGPSSSGKSTLLKIIASLLEPSDGQILFKGQQISSFRPEHYRQQVSYCFQTPVLFGETVYDNLALPWKIRQKKPDGEAIRHWLDQVNLPESILQKKIGLLSGGEKQRVALLRNLQFLPAVLLLDEVTSALDEENKQCINQLIRCLVKEQGMAVIAISHDVTEIRQAERVLTLLKPVGSRVHE